MGGKERVSRRYLRKLRKIAHSDEAGKVDIARPTSPLATKVRIWSEGGWAKLSSPECQNINQRVKRLRNLLPEEEHQTQLDAFFLGIHGKQLFDNIQFLNKNLWELLLDLEKTASERNPA